MHVALADAKEHDALDAFKTIGASTSSVITNDMAVMGVPASPLPAGQVATNTNGTAADFSNNAGDDTITGSGGDDNIAKLYVKFVSLNMPA